jgi:hypothetical protein
MRKQTLIENTKKSIAVAEAELKQLKGAARKEVRAEIEYMRSELRRLESVEA